MSERFDLSFKNKEVRMWFYLILPTVVACSIGFLYIRGEYSYLLYLVITFAWIIYYCWRFFHRRQRDHHHSKTDSHYALKKGIKNYRS